jgi:AcrR family transcriptional regulator
MEVKARIIEEARGQLMKYGYSRMRMDDLAYSLGMSKKTLYQYFEGKAELCEAVTDHICLTHKCVIGEIMAENIDFISRLRKISAFISANAMQMSNDILIDLKRNVPLLWQKIEEFRKKSIHTDFKNLIQKGINEGVFRKDINVELVLAMYYGAINHIISPENMQTANYTPLEAFNSIFSIIIAGIMTEESRKEFASSFKI